jgi:hypothetical protein
LIEEKEVIDCHKGADEVYGKKRELDVEDLGCQQAGDEHAGNCQLPHLDEDADSED